MNQSSTLVEFPRFASELSQSGPRMVEQEWLLLDLDADFVGQTLVPEMLNRYLGQTGNLEYDAEVFAKADPSLSIYSSSLEPSKAAWIPDASVDLLEIGRMPIFPGNVPEKGKPRISESLATPPTGPPPGGLQPGPGRGLWTLRVHHHTGSLEAIVSQGRRRNNFLSAGLLLLILVTTYALLRFSRRAQALAELQMNFVAGVSHELRTPLTVIRTAAYNLRGDFAAQPVYVARYGTLIRQETEKLSALVEQVLRYGNTRAGRVLQSRTPLAIPELIDAGLLAARAAAQAKDLVVEKQIEPNLPLVLADRESLQHALQNLFDNAIKYGAPTNNWIGITAAASKNGGPPEVEIRIADRGPGIPPEEREYIFDPFFRGQQPQQDQIHGTGLGLSLVKKIIEAHGGTITVHNREGQGAEFIVRIPSASARSEPEVDPSPQNEPPK